MKGRCQWRNEVIVMTTARWGRMETGRCLEIHPNSLAAQGHDPLFLGCFEDVLSIMDGKCSGRSACDVRVSETLNDIKPCYSDLTRYLQFSYECVKGNSVFSWKHMPTLSFKRIQSAPYFFHIACNEAVPSLPASGPWAPPAERDPTGVDKGGPGAQPPPNGRAKIIFFVKTEGLSSFS